MNILLTGGTGFLGSEFIRYYSKKLYSKKPSHKIFAIYRKNKGIIQKNVEWIKIDLLSKKDFERQRAILKKAHIDVVLHIGGATPNRAYAEGSFDSTTLGTKNLVDFAKSLSVKRIVFISTIAVDFSNGPYAHSKRDAENIIFQSGMDYVILRPETIIGPGAKDFNRMAEMMSKHSLLPVIRLGKNTTQPIASSDVLFMIDQCLISKKLNNKVYPAVGKDVLTMRELMQKVWIVKRKSQEHRRLSFLPLPLFLIYPLAWIVGVVYPKAGLNCERVRILSSSRKYSLVHMKDFEMAKDSLTSFDDMISFLKNP